MKIVLLALLVGAASALEAGNMKAKHGICLDASQRDRAGGKVLMWGCSSSNANQQFTYHKETKQLKNKYGLCLHAPESRNGGLVDVWPCDDDDHKQRWWIENHNGFQLVVGNQRLPNSKRLCLDASQRNTNGGKVHMWECNKGNHNQQWTFDNERHTVSVDSPDSGLIKNLFGKCVDAHHGAGRKSGGKVSMWDCNLNNKNQQFIYDAKEKMIKNVASDHCLRNSEKKLGGLVEMWKCDPTDVKQMWWYNALTNSLEASQTSQSGKICLDASQRNNNGGLLHVWRCNAGNDNQKWKMDTGAGVISDNGNTGLVKVIRGKCLDAHGPHKVGSKVAMWDCSESNTNQDWEYDANTRQMKHTASNYCLRNEESKNGGKVELWKCDTSDPFQVWWYDQWTQSLTRGSTSTQCGGKKCCLDASRRNDNGGHVHVWACDNNNANQRWHADTHSHIGIDFKDTGFIKNQHGFCVDAHNRHTDGGKVAMWPCQEGNKNQIWTYNTDTKQVQNQNGICLSYDNARKNGAKVAMATCDSKAWTQKFWYNQWDQQLKVSSSHCLDASQRSTNSGKVHIWQCDTNNANQKFTFDYNVRTCPTKCRAIGKVGMKIVHTNQKVAPGTTHQCWRDTERTCKCECNWK